MGILNAEHQSKEITGHLNRLLEVTEELCRTLRKMSTLPIAMPPNLARGLIVELNLNPLSSTKHKALIPLTQIDQIIYLKDPVFTDAIEFKNEMIPTLHLENLIQKTWTPSNTQAPAQFAILAGPQYQRTAFLVDQITEFPAFQLQTTPGLNRPGILGRATLEKTGEFVLVFDLRTAPQLFT